MRKHILLLAITFVCVASLVISAQPFYAYTEGGARVNFSVQDSIISVKPNGSRALLDQILSSVAGLDPSVEPVAISAGFFLIHVLPGQDPVAIVASLRGRDDVIFANVSLLDSLGNPTYMTEHLVANFETTTAQAQIDSMNAAHGLVVLDSLFDDPFWLLMKLTSASDLDILSMGNHFHESPLVRYAKAGMTLNVELDFEPIDDY